MTKDTGLDHREELTKAIERLQKAAAKTGTDKKSGSDQSTDELAHLESLRKTYEVGDEVDRSALMMPINSGEGLKPTDRVLISENLKNRHKVFLTSLADRITHLRKDNARVPGELAQTIDISFMKSPEFKALLGVYEQITHSETGQVSPEKLEKFLKNPMGILLVQELMDNHIRLALFASGMMQKEVLGGAARVEFISAFQSIKDSPNAAPAEYLRQIVGVDVDMLEVKKGFLGQGAKIEWKGESVANPGQLMDELKGLIDTRRLFYESLGVDSKAVDILLEMGILEGERSKMVGGATELGMNFVGKEWEAQFEATGTRSKRAILEKYREIVANDPALQNLLNRKIKSSEDKREISKLKLQHLATARVVYMNETIARIQNEPILAQRVEREENRDATITSKLQARTEVMNADGTPNPEQDGALIKKEKQAIRAQVARITQDITHVDGMRTGFDAMESIHAERDAAQKEIEAKIIALNMTTNLTTGKSMKEHEQEMITLLDRMVLDTHPKGNNVLATDELRINGQLVGKDSFKYQIAAIEDTLETNVAGKKSLPALKDAKKTESDKLTELESRKTYCDRLSEKMSGITADIKTQGKAIEEMARSIRNPNILPQSLSDLADEAKVMNQKLIDLRLQSAQVSTLLEDEKKEVLREQKEYAIAKTGLDEQEAFVQAEIKKLEDGAKRSIEQLNQASSQTVKEIAEFKNLIATRDAAEKAAAEKIKSDPALKSAEANIKALENWFTNLIGYTAGGAPAITAVQLQTLSVDEIMKKVNSAYADKVPENATTWPAEQNASEERRKQVLMAKMEALARNTAATINAPTMSERLKTMIQFQAEQETVKIAVSSTEAAVSEKFKAERESLDLAQQLVAWKTKMGGDITTARAFTLSAKVDDFIERCDSSADATLTPTEKATVAGVGYLRFLHLISGYQDIADPAAREKVFKALTARLNPGLVTKELCKFTGVSYSGDNVTPYNDIKVALTGGRAAVAAVLGSPAIPGVHDKSEHVPGLHDLAKQIGNKCVDEVIQEVSKSG